MKDLKTFRYRTTYGIQGTLLFLKEIQSVAFEEIVDIIMPTGEIRRGQVLQADKNATIIQVFEGTQSLDVVNSEIIFSRDVFRVGVSETMVGRIFNGLGEPIDELGTIIPLKRLPISGSPMNPIRREKPENFIETGISTIDGLNTLVEGQKLPIFTGSGLETSEVASQIAVNSRLLGKNRTLDIIFVAMGITERIGRFFRETFEKASSSSITFFSNYTQDSIVERLITPRVALTFAEFLAFEKGRDVLVILQDMLNYAEALREISSAREEFPGRRGYPGYLYTDLATIYERAGKVKDQKGSVTMIPIVTMPNDDITHPVPDLTGYITEGQIIMSRDLANKQVYPPINPLPSLSRLMNEGIGKGKTREDHSQLANQLFAAYAKGMNLRQLASIAGKEALTSRDQLYLNFADKFELHFISQNERRTIEETLSIGWQILTAIPKTDLNRISRTFIDKYYPEGEVLFPKLS
ncbi:MAG: V-type ATP synthase subunit B [Candidatus Heimdallarchaeota archaeon]|nr:V-type ATP synthase subunit B [Candidatus Heimdallarchaeota archaeon]